MRIAQVGVIIFIASMLAPILPLPFVALSGYVGFGIAGNLPLILLSGIVLLIAALILGTTNETWGLKRPLVGYDNTIDSLYVGGPWRQRLEELDEMEAERRSTSYERVVLIILHMCKSAPGRDTNPRDLLAGRPWHF
jgi:hypothetical protein